MRICSWSAWVHQPSAKERWKVSLPQQEQPGLKMTLKWESPPSLKKCPGKMGCTPFAESLPLYIDCKRSTNYVFDCLLSFIPLKSVSGRTAHSDVKDAARTNTKLSFWWSSFWWSRGLWLPGDRTALVMGRDTASCSVPFTRARTWACSSRAAQW